MNIQLAIGTLVLVVGTAANGTSADQEEELRSNPSKTVSIDTAVSDFNKSHEDFRIWANQSPLTRHELLAALVHEKKSLSHAMQQLADEIIETELLPSGVKLSPFRQHFGDKHATYVFLITLSFDKGPAKDKEGQVLKGKRDAEILTIRKVYLATQHLRGDQEYKPLEELLSEHKQ